MRRWGAEEMFGLGGGAISMESEEDWMNKKKFEGAIHFLLKAMEDPNNLDACRESLKKSLGEDCFGDNVRYGAPNFWSILETRPYMHLLGPLTRMYIQLENWNKATYRSLARGSTYLQLGQHGSVVLAKKVTDTCPNRLTIVAELARRITGVHTKRKYARLSKTY
ncbi:hypothetical protein EDD18DRAFT_1328702 [Armillaria luteobubalina]|uniref:Uncharacterized protein n=1 Tax=Armillaria luteobubalina TaxID=153913 RepID=A0AA39TVP9_9AGAR|nr:hypothetical protein EDD18DRAFT_1328702 [Armillaria luteobubalina]